MSRLSGMDGRMDAWMGGMDGELRHESGTLKKSWK